MEKIIETERLVLRPWREDDAEELFLNACDPEVADPAGWPAHDSVEVSLMVIREVFNAPYTFAVTMRGDDRPIGCCGIVPPEARPNVMTKGTDVEIGYWLGKRHWGRAIIPEAVIALIGLCREELRAERAWISCYAHNQKSRRVAEKCGFVYDHTDNADTQPELFFTKDLTHPH